MTRPSKIGLVLFLFLLLISLANTAQAQVERTRLIIDITGARITSIALNGDGSRVAVADGDYDTPTLRNAGRVVVYDWNGFAWNIVGEPIIGTQAEARIGENIDLSDDGNYLFIGKPFEDDGGRRDIGYVQIAVWTGTFWNTSSDPIFNVPGGTLRPFDNYGYSVARADDVDRFIGGAPGYDNSGGFANTEEGMIRVYQFDPTSVSGYEGLYEPGFEPYFGDNPGDGFGQSVDISQDGERFAVGTESGGYVKVLTFVPIPPNQYIGNHVQIGTNITDPVNTGADATGFGYNLSMAGNGERIAVMNGYTDEISTFDYDGTDWIQSGTTIAPPGPLGNDFLRRTELKLSDDGNTMTVGYFRLPGEGGSPAENGQLRVYRWTGSNWAQLGDTVFGTISNRRFGSSATISDDGQIIAASYSSNGLVQFYDITDAVLPVEITLFDGEALQKDVSLHWEAASEEDLQEYVLERSIDNGITFSPVATIPAMNYQEGARYRYTDKGAAALPTSELYYYLRSRDFDGSEALHGPIRIAPHNAEADDLKVRPNPVTAGSAIQVKGAAAGTKLELRAMDGRLLTTLQAINEGTYNLPELSPGVYIVRTLNQRGEPQTVRFVVR